MKANGAQFTLLTMGRFDDLSYFQCLMDDVEDQAIQLDQPPDLLEITPILENKLFSLLCGITDAICDYPLYLSPLHDLNPVFHVENDTIYDPINHILVNYIEYQFTVRPPTSRRLITETYDGFVWITQITMPIYNLHICTDNIEPYGLSVSLEGMSGDISLDTNLTVIDIGGGQVVYNITIPVVDEQEETYYMTAGRSYKLGIHMENLEHCLSAPIGAPTSATTTDNPTLHPTQQPTARPTDFPNDSTETTRTTGMFPVNAPTGFPTAFPNPTAYPTSNPTADPTGDPISGDIALPAIPCTRYPKAVPNTPQRDQFSSWYYFDNVTVRFGTFGEEDHTEDPSLCVPLIRLCVIENLIVPTRGPTEIPTTDPTMDFTVNPSMEPTRVPIGSGVPTEDPTFGPTASESSAPTGEPTKDPTQQPVDGNTGIPTLFPTTTPTKDPVMSLDPTTNPVDNGVPTLDPTLFPTNEPTKVPTDEPIFDDSSFPTLDPTEDPSERDTSTPTSDPTTNPTLNPIESGTPTENPSVAPTEEPIIGTETPTNVPTDNPSFAGSVSPTFDPTGVPTRNPTSHPIDSGVPTENPTSSPTVEPIVGTDAPTNMPTAIPVESGNPTENPTLFPTENPVDGTFEPSMNPTGNPVHSGVPTENPTSSPSNMPTDDPIFDDSIFPTFDPTADPTTDPVESGVPTENPTGFPTEQPIIGTNEPTNIPTDDPIFDDSLFPTLDPTALPTRNPVFGSLDPTAEPTTDPTVNPLESTSNPTKDPTTNPIESGVPTEDPTASPTTGPITGSDAPTNVPTEDPIFNDSSIPTLDPTDTPTRDPVVGTVDPTTEPTSDPVVGTDEPSSYPTSDPMKDPTFEPTSDPVIDPTGSPTHFPSEFTTEFPTFNPTENPSFVPTADPILEPTRSPTVDPTTDPTSDPTTDPSADPTTDPSSDPTSDPTADPTSDPTADPTEFPSSDPTNDPTFIPSADPTNEPSPIPTVDPTTNPTHNPTDNPTAAPIGLCKPYPVEPPDAAQCPLLCPAQETEWNFQFLNWTYWTDTDQYGHSQTRTVYTYRLRTDCHRRRRRQDGYHCIGFNHSRISIDRDYSVGTEFVELFQYQPPCCSLFDMDLIAYSSHRYEVVFDEHRYRTSWRFWLNARPCTTEHIHIAFNHFIPPFFDWNHDQWPDQSNYGSVKISGRDHRCTWNNGIVLPYPCAPTLESSDIPHSDLWPTPKTHDMITTPSIYQHHNGHSEYSHREYYGPKWWTMNDPEGDPEGDSLHSDSSETSVSESTESAESTECHLEQEMPSDWQCRREWLDIRSTEWNGELSGIEQNVYDGSSVWTYRVHVAAGYLPSHYNHWCGYYGDLAAGSTSGGNGPVLAEINRFYIGSSACCSVDDDKVADWTSYSQSHPPVDRVERGWQWDGLAISEQHNWVEFTLVFPSNIFAPIHGQFWVFSERERRCVRGATLVPDLCRISTDFMMSGALDLIVLNEHRPFRTEDGCRALIAHFEYDPEDVICKSFAYDHRERNRRKLVESTNVDTEDMMEQHIAFNFTLILEDDAMFRKLEEGIGIDIDFEHQRLGEGVKERLIENTNMTVISVSVIDLQYRSSNKTVNEQIERLQKEERNRDSLSESISENQLNSTAMAKRVGLALIVLFSVMMSISFVMSKRNGTKTYGSEQGLRPTI